MGLGYAEEQHVCMVEQMSSASNACLLDHAQWWKESQRLAVQHMHTRRWASGVSCSRP